MVYYFCLLVRQDAPQQSIESSLQQHNPQQSFFILVYLSRSIAKNAENMVQVAKKTNKIPIPANKQKLFKAGREVKEPQKKAKQSVKEVMVMDAPADAKPFFILSLIESVTGV